MYFQSPVKGGRKPLPSCVLREIKVEIERLAHKYQVSKSFVVSTVLAEAFGIKIQERYYEVNKRKK